MGKLGDIGMILGLGIASLVIYMFATGKWKFPDLGAAAAAALPPIIAYPTATTEKIYKETITTLVESRDIKDVLPAVAAVTEKSLIDPSTAGMNLLTIIPDMINEALKQKEQAPYVIPPELIQKYAAQPEYGTAGVSTAIGSQYFKSTGRILPQ